MRCGDPILNCNDRVPLTFLPSRASHEVAGNRGFLGEWGKGRDLVPDSALLLAISMVRLILVSGIRPVVARCIPC